MGNVKASKHVLLAVYCRELQDYKNLEMEATGLSSQADHKASSLACIAFNTPVTQNLKWSPGSVTCYRSGPKKNPTYLVVISSTSAMGNRLRIQQAFTAQEILEAPQAALEDYVQHLVDSLYEEMTSDKGPDSATLTDDDPDLEELDLLP